MSQNNWTTVTLKGMIKTVFFYNTKLLKEICWSGLYFGKLFPKMQFPSIHFLLPENQNMFYPDFKVKIAIFSEA